MKFSSYVPSCVENVLANNFPFKKRAPHFGASFCRSMSHFYFLLSPFDAREYCRAESRKACTNQAKKKNQQSISKKKKLIFCSFVLEI